MSHRCLPERVAFVIGHFIVDLRVEGGQSEPCGIGRGLRRGLLVTSGRGLARHNSQPGAAQAEPLGASLAGCSNSVAWRIVAAALRRPCTWSCRSRGSLARWLQPRLPAAAIARGGMQRPPLRRLVRSSMTSLRSLHGSLLEAWSAIWNGWGRCWSRRPHAQEERAQVLKSGKTCKMARCGHPIA